MLLLTKMSKEPVYYGDLQHIDKSKNEIKIIGDGACPPYLAGKLGPAGFAEHGIPTEGEIPFWPHGFVTAHCDVDEMIRNWTNEYACLGYGDHLYPALIDFCEMTGIKTILP